MYMDGVDQHGRVSIACGGKLWGGPRQWKMQDGRWKMEDGRWKIEVVVVILSSLCYYLK